MLEPRRPSPATEAVLTMAPRAALSAGAAARAQRNGPMRFVDRMSCQNSSVMASRSAKSIGRCAPGVVDQDVEPAELLDRLANHALGVAGSRDVAGRGHDLQARGV